MIVPSTAALGRHALQPQRRHPEADQVERDDQRHAAEQVDVAGRRARARGRTPGRAACAAPRSAAPARGRRSRATTSTRMLSHSPSSTGGSDAQADRGVEERRLHPRPARRARHADDRRPRRTRRCETSATSGRPAGARAPVAPAARPTGRARLSCRRHVSSGAPPGRGEPLLLQRRERASPTAARRRPAETQAVSGLSLSSTSPNCSGVPPGRQLPDDLGVRPARPR